MKTTQVFLGITIFLLFAVTINAQIIQDKAIEKQESTLIRTSNSIELIGSSEARELQVEVARKQHIFKTESKIS